MDWTLKGCAMRGTLGQQGQQGLRSAGSQSAPCSMIELPYPSETSQKFAQLLPEFPGEMGLTTLTSAFSLVNISEGCGSH